MEDRDDSVDKATLFHSKSLTKDVLFIKEERNEFFLKMEDIIKLDEKKIEEYSYTENSLWNVIRYSHKKMVWKIKNLLTIRKVYFIKIKFKLSIIQKLI